LAIYSEYPTPFQLAEIALEPFLIAEWQNDATGMTSAIPEHAYEVRPRKDHRGFDLISDALPFDRLSGSLHRIAQDRQLTGPHERH
jgi:hypothetical protein